jgi:hypothetical protein
MHAREGESETCRKWGREGSGCVRDALHVVVHCDVVRGEQIENVRRLRVLTLIEHLQTTQQKKEEERKEGQGGEEDGKGRGG